ncbi:MAG: IS3 family transposase [Anaerovoracaceae bacterium]
MSKKRPSYSDDFRRQIVELYKNGKATVEIEREYSIARSSIHKWIKDYDNSGSFKANDNRTESEKELIQLRKEHKRLLMENDILKQAGADYGAKVKIIKENKGKYPISAMCKELGISRARVYYAPKTKPDEEDLEKKIRKIFYKNRKAYGTRRIRKALAKKGIRISRRKVAVIMKKLNLVSTYSRKSYKPQPTGCNESKVANIVAGEFDNRKALEVVVSDLTYVQVGGKWNYICSLLDLFNREIIGYAVGKRKDAQLVSKALMNSNQSLLKIKLFHTDRGNEFKNKIVQNILDAFEIERSLSKKGTPTDNAVAEAMFKTIKTEFVYGKKFETIEELEREFFDYVNWYNNHRLHSSLGYETPKDYRLMFER